MEDIIPFAVCNNSKLLTIASVADCVWVKINKYPWWPAKVTEVLHQGGKKKIIVSCFGDNSKANITSSKSIRLWNCAEHNVMVDRGKANRNHRDKILFGKAMAEIKQYISSSTEVCPQSITSEHLNVVNNSLSSSNGNRLADSLKKDDSDGDIPDATIQIAKKRKLLDWQSNVDPTYDTKEIVIDSQKADSSKYSALSDNFDGITAIRSISEIDDVKLDYDSSDYDFNKDDDDDALLMEEGLTPQKQLSKRPPVPGDIIWYKYEKDPHWPCLVLKTYKETNKTNKTTKKTKRTTKKIEKITKLKILFLISNQTLITARMKNWAFFFSECERYKIAGKKSKYSEDFMKSVNLAERLFLRKDKDMASIFKEINYVPETRNVRSTYSDTDSSDKESDFGYDIIPIQEPKTLFGIQVTEIADDSDLSKGKEGFETLSQLADCCKNDNHTNDNEDTKFSEGDYLWAKFPTCPWWPVKVIDIETSDATETITVSFFGENSMESFKSSSNSIRLWNCKEKRKMIKTGMHSKTLFGKIEAKEMFKKAMTEAKDYIKDQYRVSKIDNGDKNNNTTDEEVTRTPEPGDIIWYKHKLLSYWPAMIYDILGTNKAAKFIIIFFQIQDIYSIPNTRKWQFFDECQEHRARHLEGKLHEDFTQAVNLAESFLNRTDEDIEFLAEEILKYESENEDEIEDDDTVINRQLSQDLMNIIVSDDMKSMLKRIHAGEESSWRHHTFTLGSRSAIANLKLQAGFGPIHKNQYHELMSTLEEIYYEINNDLNPEDIFFQCHSYCYDVLLPEAIIRSLRSHYNLTLEEAEKKYLS
ncbi:hypothetical protein TrispH2_001304 [Trichoplax sp. H2]|nr:hypothetical protein TrispH2_001304 [Trichoplax sp. H2]|eukprot:RDD46350.1 hypothetical protein TrispH2_001304 [Trichoplax sp. H2]